LLVGRHPRRRRPPRRWGVVLHVNPFGGSRRRACPRRPAATVGILLVVLLVAAVVLGTVQAILG
jgi:hypothetical protein